LGGAVGSFKLEIFVFPGISIMDSPSSKAAGIERGGMARGPSLGGCRGVPAGVKGFGMSEMRLFEVEVKVGEVEKEEAGVGLDPEGNKVTT
jgi:hypothetical protein